VTLFGDGTGRASLNALSAFFIPKRGTILFVVVIFSLSRCQFQKRDDAPDSDGHPFRGDEAIVEAEGSKTAGISHMAF
jgi:hypothetical protein